MIIRESIDHENHGNRRRMKRGRSVTESLACVAMVIAAAGCGGGEGDDSTTPNGSGGSEQSPEGGTTSGGRSDDVIARNNRGVGLMGQYRYDAAYDVFRALADDAPGDDEILVNLAIASLNRQQEGDDVTTRELLNDVLSRQPNHLRARFTLALLQQYDGESDLAAEHLEAVVAADPTDAYASYFLAQAIEESAPERALALYETSIEHEPYLRSAYYRAAGVQRRLGDADRARSLLDLFNRLDQNPQATTAEIAYRRMGPKAEALAFGLNETGDQAVAQTASLPDGLLFAAPRPVDGGGVVTPVVPGGESVPQMTAADLNADGLDDLFVASASDTRLAPNAVWLQQADGTFVADPDHVLASVRDVNAALWGDIDNNGFIDVYFCRRGANHLWRQVAANDWRLLPLDAGAGGSDANTICGLLADFDHDGDLDIYCGNESAPINC